MKANEQIQIQIIHQAENTRPMIIDFHIHLFPEKIAAKVVENLSHMSHTVYFLTPVRSETAASMKEARIDYSVNLPVMTRAEQVSAVNDHIISSYEEDLLAGIINFGGMHPDFTDYKKELRRLKRSGIKGIKIHPAYQGADLNDIRYKRILACAEEEGLITVTHAGVDVGYPDKNFASVEMILDILKDVAPQKLVLAHLGAWQGWSEFESDLAGAPVYIDTSFAFTPLVPREDEKNQFVFHDNLKKEDFTRIVCKHGTKKVLFGTDLPWAPQKDYVRFVQECSLENTQKEDILGKNAQALLGSLSAI